LFELAAVIVTFAPLAFRLPDVVPLVPTTTLPTPSVLGVTFSCPTAAVPVPDRGMVRVGVEAFEVMATVPLAVPADCGAKATENVVL
jgi:hypothetical protein